MNEEIHASSNIPLCISSQNDTAYYINLENNRRFTDSEGEKMLSSSESEKGLGSVTPTLNFSRISAGLFPSRVQPQQGKTWLRAPPQDLLAELLNRGFSQKSSHLLFHPVQGEVLG